MRQMSTLRRACLVARAGRWLGFSFNPTRRRDKDTEPFLEEDDTVGRQGLLSRCQAQP